MLFEHTGTKCLAVDSNEGSLTIEYDVPDMVDLEENAQEKIIRENWDNKGAKYEERYQRHMDDKLEKMKKRNQNNRDLSIVLSTRSAAKHILNDSGQRVSDAKHLRVTLEDKKGKIEFDTGDYFGPVDICIRSLYASKSNPSRIGIHVIEIYDDEDDEMVVMRRMLEEKKRKEQLKDFHEEKDLVEQKMSSFTIEIKKIEKLLITAERESRSCWSLYEKFFQDGVKMKREMSFWPTVRIIITLIGGTMQVMSIIKFFQNKHIF